MSNSNVPSIFTLLLIKKKEKKSNRGKRPKAQRSFGIVLPPPTKETFTFISIK